MRRVTDIKDPLSPHVLSHVMTELLETYTPTDEGEIDNDLRESGYRQNERDQIMTAWLDHWRATSVVTQCSACGEPATHMWGALDEHTGHFGSMAGDGVLSPSCDGCAGRLDEQTIIQAPLGRSDTALPESLGARSGLDAQVPTPSQLANAFALDDPSKIYNAVVKACESDGVTTRTAVVGSIVALCRTIADQPHQERTGFSYDTAFLGVIQDVFGWDR